MAYETNTTVGALVDATLEHLLGAAREEMNRVTNPVGTTDTTITFDFPLAGATRGTYLGIDDEVVYVWASPATPGIQNVTVQRAMKGTTATSHAAGALAKVNPEFTRAEIRGALKDEIRSWGPQVFSVTSEEIAAKDGVRGYDLGAITPFYFVLEVRHSPNVSMGQTSNVVWPTVNFEVIRSAPASDFPSGSGLVIRDNVSVMSFPVTFHVIYGKPFDVDDAFDDTTDLLTNVGMDISDLDIAPYGAAWRKAAFREMRRTFAQAQGQPSDLQNDPPLYSMRMADELKKIRDSRLGDAEWRLRSQYPLRKG